MNYIAEYNRQIKSGEIIAGRWIKLIYQKLNEGLEKGLYFYNEKQAQTIIDFIETFCHHSEGRSDKLKLELWQKATLAAIYGIVDADGVRQWREVFLVIGRKNGKTLLASSIAEAELTIGGEYGAKAYCLAPKLEQADKTFDGLLQMLDKEPAIKKYFTKRRTDLYMPSTNSSIKPLAFNDRKSDGFNPQLVVCDEIASWPAERGLKQYEVMKSALGSRRSPLILSISTSGYISDGPFDELYKRSTALLEGTSKESRLLPLIYQIDDIEKWDDLEELKKSNPNLDISVSSDFYREEIEIARNSTSKKSEFLTKYCNIKQGSTAAWLPFEIIEGASGDDYNLEDFRNSYAVGGLDLSQTTDLTAACVLIEKDDRIYTFTQFFMPENKIDELQAREGVPYRIYQKRGLLTASGENYVDYNDVFNWYRHLVEDYQIFPLQIGYDRYSAQYLIQDMQAYGFHTDDVYQGENLTPVIREAEGLLRDKTLRIGNNSLLQSHIANTAVKRNEETRKMRTVKIEQRCHIDGCVAMLDALTVRQKWYDDIGEQLKNKE